MVKTSEIGPGKWGRQDDWLSYKQSGPYNKTVHTGKQI